MFDVLSKKDLKAKGHPREERLILIRKPLTFAEQKY